MNFFVANDVRIAYRTDGPADAPTVVLVNSLGTDLRMWDSQIEPLSQHFRVLRYDFRGHGASSVPAEPYTIEQFGLELLALLNTLQIERAHICGLSLGGIIALYFVSQYPERANRAVFANTAARIGTEATWDARIDVVKKGGMAAIQDAVLARFLSAGFRQQRPEVTRKISAMVEATNPVGYIGACAALRDADLRGTVSSIHVPSLIIGSELDESTPPAQAKELHTSIAESKLVIFPQTAHLSSVEQSEAFSEHVLRFLG